MAAPIGSAAPTFFAPGLDASPSILLRNGLMQILDIHPLGSSAENMDAVRLHHQMNSDTD